MAAKKLLGCLLVVLLVGVIGLAAGYWFILRPMWNAGSDFVQGARDWASAVDLGDDIANQAPYAPPADGRMTPQQVQAFVQVQSVIAREMGGDLAALGQRVRDAEAARAGAEPSLQDVATAYRELSGLMSKLRAAQAKGVNEVGLSREEYAFLRRQSLAALPLLADVGSLPGFPALSAATGAEADDASAMAAARHNAELLRPHLPLLSRTLGANPLAP